MKRESSAYLRSVVDLVDIAQRNWVMLTKRKWKRVIAWAGTYLTSQFHPWAKWVSRATSEGTTEETGFALVEMESAVERRKRTLRGCAREKVPTARAWMKGFRAERSCLPGTVASAETLASAEPGCRWVVVCAEEKQVAGTVDCVPAGAVDGVASAVDSGWGGKKTR